MKASLPVEHVHSHVSTVVVADPAEIARSDSPLAKSYLRITFTMLDGSTVTHAISSNLAEMIGGLGAGVRGRREIEAKPFTPDGQEERVEDYAPMTGKSLSCTKCGLQASTLLHRFCQHRVCPVRSLLK